MQLLKKRPTVSCLLYTSDIHVYSIDEVFMDVTQYLEIYGMTPAQLAGKIIRDVLAQTGITAAGGIAPNLYLCKAALDIVAKHVSPDEDGAVSYTHLKTRSISLWQND